jgi:undecaprenyl diphosphate synthase
MHVAIIMHGNRQWARQHDLPSTAGHAAGAAALHTTVALAISARVRTFTLYSICGTGGECPPDDKDANLQVLDSFLGNDLQWCLEKSVRISLIGNSERLNWLLPVLRDHNEHPSIAQSQLHLRIVVDYSAHDRIVKAVWRADNTHAPEQFYRQLCEIDPTALGAGAVDVLIRIGGAWCRSEFMLWEAAYANLHFVDRLWPDFTADDFQQALNCHAGRYLA